MITITNEQIPNDGDIRQIFSGDKIVASIIKHLDRLVILINTEDQQEQQTNIFLDIAIDSLEVISTGDLCLDAKMKCKKAYFSARSLTTFQPLDCEELNYTIKETLILDEGITRVKNKLTIKAETVYQKAPLIVDHACHIRINQMHSSANLSFNAPEFFEIKHLNVAGDVILNMKNGEYALGQWVMTEQTSLIVDNAHVKNNLALLKTKEMRFSNNSVVASKNAMLDSMKGVIQESKIITEQRLHLGGNWILQLSEFKYGYLKVEGLVRDRASLWRSDNSRELVDSVVGILRLTNSDFSTKNHLKIEEDGRLIVNQNQNREQPFEGKKITIKGAAQFLYVDCKTTEGFSFEGNFLHGENACIDDGANIRLAGQEVLFKSVKASSEVITISSNLNVNDSTVTGKTALKILKSARIRGQKNNFYSRAGLDVYGIVNLDKTQFTVDGPLKVYNQFSLTGGRDYRLTVEEDFIVAALSKVTIGIVVDLKGNITNEGFAKFVGDCKLNGLGNFSLLPRSQTTFLSAALEDLESKEYKVFSPELNIGKIYSSSEESLTKGHSVSVKAKEILLNGKSHLTGRVKHKADQWVNFAEQNIVNLEIKANIKAENNKLVYSDNITVVSPAWFNNDYISARWSFALRSVLSRMGELVLHGKSDIKTILSLDMVDPIFIPNSIHSILDLDGILAFIKNHVLTALPTKHVSNFISLSSTAFSLVKRLADKQSDLSQQYVKFCETQREHNNKNHLIEFVMSLSYSEWLSLLWELDAVKDIAKELVKSTDSLFLEVKKEKNQEAKLDDKVDSISWRKRASLEYLQVIGQTSLSALREAYSTLDSAEALMQAALKNRPSFSWVAIKSAPYDVVLHIQSAWGKLPEYTVPLAFAQCMPQQMEKSLFSSNMFSMLPNYSSTHFFNANLGFDFALSRRMAASYGYNNGIYAAWDTVHQVGDITYYGGAVYSFLRTNLNYGNFDCEQAIFDIRRGQMTGNDLKVRESNIKSENIAYAFKNSMNFDKQTSLVHTGRVFYKTTTLTDDAKTKFTGEFSVEAKNIVRNGQYSGDRFSLVADHAENAGPIDVEHAKLDAKVMDNSSEIKANSIEHKFGTLNNTKTGKIIKDKAAYAAWSKEQSAQTDTQPTKTSADDAATKPQASIFTAAITNNDGLIFVPGVKTDLGKANSGGKVVSVYETDISYDTWKNTPGSSVDVRDGTTAGNAFSAENSNISHEDMVATATESFRLDEATELNLTGDNTVNTKDMEIGPTTGNGLLKANASNSFRNSRPVTVPTLDLTTASATIGGATNADKIRLDVTTLQVEARLATDEAHYKIDNKLTNNSEIIIGREAYANYLVEQAANSTHESVDAAENTDVKTPTTEDGATTVIPTTDAEMSAPPVDASENREQLQPTSDATAHEIENNNLIFAANTSVETDFLSGTGSLTQVGGSTLVTNKSLNYQGAITTPSLSTNGTQAIFLGPVVTGHTKNRADLFYTEKSFFSLSIDLQGQRFESSGTFVTYHNQQFNFHHIRFRASPNSVISIPNGKVIGSNLEAGGHYASYDPRSNAERDYVKTRAKYGEDFTQALISAGMLDPHVQGVDDVNNDTCSILLNNVQFIINGDTFFFPSVNASLEGLSGINSVRFTDFSNTHIQDTYTIDACDFAHYGRYEGQTAIFRLAFADYPIFEGSSNLEFVEYYCKSYLLNQRNDSAYQITKNQIIDFLGLNYGSIGQYLFNKNVPTSVLNIRNGSYGGPIQSDYPITLSYLSSLFLKAPILAPKISIGAEGYIENFSSLTASEAISLQAGCGYSNEENSSLQAPSISIDANTDIIFQRKQTVTASLLTTHSKRGDVVIRSPIGAANHVNITQDNKQANMKVISDAPLSVKLLTTFIPDKVEKNTIYVYRAYPSNIKNPTAKDVKAYITVVDNDGNKYFSFYDDTLITAGKLFSQSNKKPSKQDQTLITKIRDICAGRFRLNNNGSIEGGDGVGYGGVGFVAKVANVELMGNASIGAGGDIDIEATSFKANTPLVITKEEFIRKHGKSLFQKLFDQGRLKVKITQEVLGASVSSDHGSIKIHAAEDISAQSLTLHASNGKDIKAGGSIAMESTVTESTTVRTQEGFAFKGSVSRKQTSTPTKITGGGSTKIHADGEVKLLGVKVDGPDNGSKGHLTVSSNTLVTLDQTKLQQDKVGLQTVVEVYVNGIELGKLIKTASNSAVALFKNKRLPKEEWIRQFHDLVKAKEPLVQYINAGMDSDNVYEKMIALTNAGIEGAEILNIIAKGINHDDVIGGLEKRYGFDHIDVSVKVTERYMHVQETKLATNEFVNQDSITISAPNVNILGGTAWLANDNIIFKVPGTVAAIPSKLPHKATVIDYSVIFSFNPITGFGFGLGYSKSKSKGYTIAAPIFIANGTMQYDVGTMTGTIELISDRQVGIIHQLNLTSVPDKEKISHSQFSATTSFDVSAFQGGGTHKTMGNGAAFIKGNDASGLRIDEVVVTGATLILPQASIGTAEAHRIRNLGNIYQGFGASANLDDMSNYIMATDDDPNASLFLKPGIRVAITNQQYDQKPVISGATIDSVTGHLATEGDGKVKKHDDSFDSIITVPLTTEKRVDDAINHVATAGKKVGEQVSSLFTSDQQSPVPAVSQHTPKPLSIDDFLPPPEISSTHIGALVQLTPEQIAFCENLYNDSEFFKREIINARATLSDEDIAEMLSTNDTSVLQRLSEKSDDIARNFSIYLLLNKVGQAVLNAAKMTGNAVATPAVMAAYGGCVYGSTAFVNSTIDAFIASKNHSFAEFLEIYGPDILINTATAAVTGAATMTVGASIPSVSATAPTAVKVLAEATRMTAQVTTSTTVSSVLHDHQLPSPETLVENLALGAVMSGVDLAGAALINSLPRPVNPQVERVPSTAPGAFNPQKLAKRVRTEVDRLKTSTIDVTPALAPKNMTDQSVQSNAKRITDQSVKSPANVDTGMTKAANTIKNTIAPLPIPTKDSSSFHERDITEMSTAAPSLARNVTHQPTAEQSLAGMRFFNNYSSELRNVKLFGDRDHPPVFASKYPNDIHDMAPTFEKLNCYDLRRVVGTTVPVKYIYVILPEDGKLIITPTHSNPVALTKEEIKQYAELNGPIVGLVNVANKFYHTKKSPDGDLIVFDPDTQQPVGKKVLLHHSDIAEYKPVVAAGDIYIKQGAIYRNPNGHLDGIDNCAPSYDCKGNNLDKVVEHIFLKQGFDEASGSFRNRAGNKKTSNLVKREERDGHENIALTRTVVDLKKDSLEKFGVPEYPVLYSNLITNDIHYPPPPFKSLTVDDVRSFSKNTIGIDLYRYVILKDGRLIINDGYSDLLPLKEHEIEQLSKMTPDGFTKYRGKICGVIRIGEDEYAIFNPGEKKPLGKLIALAHPEIAHLDEVVSAGDFYVKNGKIIKPKPVPEGTSLRQWPKQGINSHSGHYRPRELQQKKIVEHVFLRHGFEEAEGCFDTQMAAKIALVSAQEPPMPIATNRGQAIPNIAQNCFGVNKPTPWHRTHSIFQNVLSLNKFAYGLVELPFNFVAGECLFNAIAHGMQSFDSLELRHTAIIELMNNRAQYEPYLEVPSSVSVNGGEKINYHSFEEYVSLMSNQTTWGGHLEVIAVSNALQQSFIIFNEYSPAHRESIIGKEYIAPNNPPVFLGRVSLNNDGHLNHYVPLQLPANKTAFDIVDEIEKALTTRQVRFL